MVSAQSPQAWGMLAVGLALRRSIKRIARRLRLGSPRSMLSNSVAAQLIVFVAMKSVAYIMTSADLCITKCFKDPLGKRQGIILIFLASRS
jgi:hypothetical protein